MWTKQLLVRSEQSENSNNSTYYYFFSQMTSDRMFKEPVARAAKHLALKNTSPVYFYEFDYRGKHSLSNVYIKAGSSDGFGKL